MSSYWHPDTGADTVASSSYESIEMNLMQPIRATQLAIDYFLRQKLGHGAVLLASSIAAQMALLPTPLYPAGKHVISGFTRSLAHLEEDINIHANAIASGVVRPPIWSANKAARLHRNEVSWDTIDRVADVMMITNQSMLVVWSLKLVLTYSTCARAQ